MSNEGKSKAKDIAPIFDIGRDVLLRDLDEFSQKMLADDYYQTYHGILTHMNLTMKKMNRFDATAILISYIFAAKDLVDESFSDMNSCLAAYFDIDIEIFNQTEREFLKCEEINYNISHIKSESKQDVCEESSVEPKESKTDISALFNLVMEISNYRRYISDKKGGEWDLKRKMLKDLDSILCESNITIKTKLTNFYEYFDKNKEILTKNPDPRTNSFMRQVTYILATCITLGIFNVARMAYRACSGNAYVSFSKKFSGEKFVEHVENIGKNRPTATH